MDPMHPELVRLHAAQLRSDADRHHLAAALRRRRRAERRAEAERARAGRPRATAPATPGWAS
jgi:hypothetical protein